MREVLRTLVAGGLALSVAAPAAAQSAAADAPPSPVHVVAGLGGIAKPGRWLPVWVSIDHAGDAPLRGRISLSWGTTTLERHIELASAGRREIELYIRTADIEDAVTVRVDTSDGASHAIDAPVSIVPVTEPVTACLVPPGAAASITGCSIVIPTDRLPGSPRGYDAVNSIAWPAGDVPLGSPYGDALAEWQAVRALEDAGDLGVTPQVTRPVLRRGLPGPTGVTLLAGSALYVIALSLLASAALSRRLTLPRLAVASAATLAAATAGSLWLGAVGPASAVRLHLTTLVQQIPGTRASLLTMRGVAEFPSSDVYTLGLPAVDAMVEVASGPGAVRQEMDVSGYPMLSGSFGLGSRQAFAAEAWGDVQPLEVTAADGRARIRNVTTRTLRDCRFGDVGMEGATRSLAPGAVLTGTYADDHLGPLATCTLDAPVLPFTAGAAAVDAMGATTVVAYLPREHGAFAAELAND